MVLEVAFMFKALKIALDDLEEFYHRLITPEAKVNRNQLLFPYYNNVRIEETIYKLTYVTKLEGRNIFQATMNIDTESSRDVVVKFTKRYSEDCHRACYHLRISPELLACEKLSGGWYVVVMEFLKNHTTLFSLAQKNLLALTMWPSIEDAVRKMHRTGFVHGDLRLPNIMWALDGSIKIIDFDWAGKDSQVTYPPLLNRESNIPWHDGVRFGVNITTKHDWHLLTTQFCNALGVKEFVRLHV
ncbi:kinase-like domain-containing protein [Jimgerdemannia flammicorona]|uniref:Kinase-like domain-containing protein n=1 Tax=Jimgerdemannia flammicorona TaxID=994334 RepID=A0A433QSA2_9FUNG|nr:kinase-like domain-containing protein [Jimgerdemannia flammicorona]